jgi:hypothetical protein
MPAAQQQIPQHLISKLRTICMALPAAYEEPAWVGTRWCIAKKNFAHVIMIKDGHPPNYAKAANSNGPHCILTFRSDLAEYDPAIFQHDPYFKPVWFRNIAGMKLDRDSNWNTVKDHIEASYRLLAQKR